MQETCWKLQVEEIVLLRSIYCGAGEFLAYFVPTDCPPHGRYTEECTALWESSAEDDTCLPRAPSEMETVRICIKLQVHAPLDRDVGAMVQFYLPKLYPHLEPPEVTISSQYAPTGCLMDLSGRISSHCKALLPQPCLFNILEEIKTELMKLESSDTPELLREPVKKQFTSKKPQSVVM